MYVFNCHAMFMLSLHVGSIDIAKAALCPHSVKSCCSTLAFNYIISVNIMWIGTQQLMLPVLQRETRSYGSVEFDFMCRLFCLQQDYKTNHPSIYSPTLLYYA